MRLRTRGIGILALLAATGLWACSGSGAVPAPAASTSSSTPNTLPATTTTQSTTTVPPTSTSQPPAWSPPSVCEGPCDPAVEVLFTVPIGVDGVSYANVGADEMVGSGPSSIAVAGSDRIWITDAVGRRVLSFTFSGDPVAVIDLTEYEVAAAVDIAATVDGVVLLDVFVAAQRYRLLEFDGDGALTAIHDLPAGVHLEDGLTGVAAGRHGELWLELEFGARSAVLDTSGTTIEFSIVPGYVYPTGHYYPVAGRPFAFQASEVEVDVATQAELGGLRLLGVNPDSSFILVLDEVTFDAGGALVVDESVHLFDSTGNHLGESVVPISNQFVEVGHPLAVGLDGNVYALVTKPDGVDVVRLPYSG